jgi:deazaflavin-dependent oxidoreductase (nitroreductase family)
MTPAESLPDDRSDRTLRVPGFIGVFNPMARRLVQAGLMGPNVLLTVRGRKSGVPRTTPVALVKIGGRRWIIGTFGAVDWVRNVRAAGRATITSKGRAEEVEAIELSPTEGADFFRRVLTPYVNRLVIGRLLLRFLGAADILSDPQGAAERRPVFELRPLG